MNLEHININVDITGDVITYSKDGIIIPELTGSTDVLPLILLITNYYNRKLYFNKIFNSTCPNINVNLTTVNDEGETSILSNITISKLIIFIEKMCNIKYEDLNNKQLKDDNKF